MYPNGKKTKVERQNILNPMITTLLSGAYRHTIVKISECEPSINHGPRTHNQSWSLEYLHSAASRAELTSGQTLRVDVGHKRALSEVCDAATKDGESRQPWNCVAEAGKQAVREGNHIEEGGVWGCKKYIMCNSLHRKRIQHVAREELNLRLINYFVVQIVTLTSPPSNTWYERLRITKKEV